MATPPDLPQPSAGHAGWPPVGWEELPWRSTLPPEVLTRSQTELLSRPYRAAVTPAIADRDVRLPRETAAAAERAARRVIDFDREAGRDGIVPFAAVLLRSESASSSQIENLTSGAKQIALAELGEDARRNAIEIVGNVHAMQAALELSDHVDPDSILAVHRALLSAAGSDAAGRWRTEQVWSGGGGYSPHQARFIPPAAGRVPLAIDDLCTFAVRDDIPALTHVALTHAQFETIHPFVDGNGRTGRALVHSMLRRRGLARSVTVPLSAGLLVDIDGYFQALTAYRSGDAAAIVESFSRAADAAVVNGRALLSDLTAARRLWADALRARADSAAWPLLDLVCRQPVISAALVQEELGIAPNNALRAIRRLEDAGVLHRIGGRRRSVLWQAPQVLSALDAFAARAGRRPPARSAGRG